MPWEPKYPNFGVIKIEGKKVKVYSDRSNYITIGLGEDVTNAVWRAARLPFSYRCMPTRD